MTQSRLAGLHHLSAISSHAQNTIDFYSGVLGMPLLKQTVNYDDPESFHLYFGNPDLQLGTMTFFVWPGAHRGQIGRGGTSHVNFALSSDADVDRWDSWLAQHGIATTAASRADGAIILRLEDPDGLQIELVSPAHEFEPNSAASHPRGFATSAIAPPRLGPIDRVAVIVSDIERSTSFYAETLGSLPSVVLLQADATTPEFRLGAGLTHHFALQVADANGLVAWRDHLNDSGVPTTDVKDRRYFQSIYFRDPDGHVLEIATTGPGFAIDEPQSELGQRLALPPWLEDRRSEIVQRLPLLNAHPTTRV